MDVADRTLSAKDFMSKEVSGRWTLASFVLDSIDDSPPRGHNVRARNPPGDPPMKSFICIVLTILSLWLTSLSLEAQSAAFRTTPPSLSCSPAPCVLPEVATGGLLTSSFAVNPANPQQLMFGDGSGSSSAVEHSSDGGMTWTRTLLPNLGIGGTNGLAYVGYDLNGKAYATWADLSEPAGGSAIAFSSSSDNGSAWATATLVVPSIDGSGEAADFLIVDNNPSSPFVNAIYIASDLVNGFGEVGIQVSYSQDGGATWNIAEVIPPITLTSATYAKLATAKDGTVYVAWDSPQASSCSGVKIAVSKSTTGGRLWSSPANVTKVQQPPNCHLPNTNWVVSLYPTIAVDNSSGPFSGRLYVSSYNWTGTQMQVQVTSSSNGGARWSAPVRVASTGVNDEFNPWISVSASGVLGVTWLDRRDDPANLKYRAYAAVSTNGGKSFGNNVAIAGGLTDPSTGFPDTTLDLWNGTALFGVFPDAALTGALQDVLGGVELTH
jgi:hypothetical protein